MRDRTSEVVSIPDALVGPVNPHYLRLRPRRLTWRQRLRILFGARITAYVELDLDRGGYCQGRAYLDGAPIRVDLARGDEWEALAPGGLLSPSQSACFLGLMVSGPELKALRSLEPMRIIRTREDPTDDDADNCEDTVSAACAGDVMAALGIPPRGPDPLHEALKQWAAKDLDETFGVGPDDDSRPIEEVRPHPGPCRQGVHCGEIKEYDEENEQWVCHECKRPAPWTDEDLDTNDPPRRTP